MNEAVFSTWEPLLLALCQHQTPFFTILVEEAVKILVLSSTSNEKERNPYYEGIYMWLERIFEPSTAWTGMREYLVLSYTQAICKASNGPLAERLHQLLGDLSASPDISMDDDTSRNESGRHTTISTCRTDEDTDIAALREYGWTMSETRDSRPIGVL